MRVGEDEAVLKLLAVALEEVEYRAQRLEELGFPALADLLRREYGLW